LAGVYSARARFKEAEAHYKRALAIVEKAVGSDHPDVAQNLQKLLIPLNPAAPRVVTGAPRSARNIP
jgi:hypothetical protein